MRRAVADALWLPPSQLKVALDFDRLVFLAPENIELGLGSSAAATKFPRQIPLYAYCLIYAH